MNTADSTFELVQSMSASEKAYFKKDLDKSLASIKKEKIYKMFTLFAKSKTYDKEAFTLKTKRLGFNNYTKAKHELYKLLIQSLVAYNKDRLAEYEIFEKLLAAKMLQNRGMINESLKELELAENLNEKKSVTEISPYISIRKNYYSPYAPEYSKYKTDSLHDAEGKLNTLFDVVQYEKISAQNIPFVLNIGTVCKTDEERKHFKEVLELELLTTYTPKSNFGLMMKQHLICFYSYLLNDIKRAYKAACEAIALVQEDLKDCDQGTLQNLSIFHYNAIQYAFSLKDSDIFNYHINAISSIETFLSSKHYKKRIQGELIFLNLNWSLETKDYVAALREAEKLNELEEDLFVYNQSVLSEIYMKIALCYLYNKKYNEAIDHISKFFQNQDIHSLPEEKTVLSLLEILCHIKLENIELAEALTRSLYRNLKKQNRLFEFEKVLVRFFKELFQAPRNKKAREELNLKYLTEIQALKELKTENFFLDLFDLENWISEGVMLNQA